MPLIDPSSYKAPFLLGNKHLQTILPSYLRHETDIAYDREPFATPDDDVIQLDWSRIGSDKLLIINHGLCGHTHRHYVLSLVKAFNASITLDISPPLATSAKGLAAMLLLAEKRKLTLSIPVGCNSSDFVTSAPKTAAGISI